MARLQTRRWARRIGGLRRSSPLHPRRIRCSQTDATTDAMKSGPHTASPFRLAFQTPRQKSKRKWPPCQLTLRQPIAENLKEGATRPSGGWGCPPEPALLKTTTFNRIDTAAPDRPGRRSSQHSCHQCPTPPRPLVTPNGQHDGHVGHKNAEPSRYSCHQCPTPPRPLVTPNGQHDGHVGHKNAEPGTTGRGDALVTASLPACGGAEPRGLRRHRSPPVPSARPTTQPERGHDQPHTPGRRNARKRRGLPLHGVGIPIAKQQLQAKLRVPLVSLHPTPRAPASLSAMSPRTCSPRVSSLPPKAKH